MVDVTLVTSSSQIAPVQTGSGQPNVSSQSALHTGTIISGVIAGKDSAGNFLLRTDSGTFALKSSAALTYNSDVVIQIASGGNTARVLTVNGESFANYTTPEPATTDSLSPSLLANLSQEVLSASEVAPAPAQPQASPQIAVQATVTSSSPQVATTQTSNEIALPPQGSTVTIQVTLPANAISNSLGNGTEPATTTTVIAAPSSAPAPAEASSIVSAYTPAAVPAIPAQPVTDTNATPLANTNVTTLADAPTSSVAITASAVQGTPSSANVTEQNTSASQLSQYATYSRQGITPSIIENQTSAPVNLQSANVTTLPAQIVEDVTASLPSNSVALSTSLGTITVQAAEASILNSLPSDSILTIAFSALPASTESLGSTIPSPLLTGGWQTLSDIINVLNTGDSDISSGLISRLPQLGENNFTASSFSMISLLAQGNIHEILGDEAINDLRQKGRSDLLQRMGEELGSLNNEPDIASTAGHNNNSTWQPIFLPFMFQEEIQQARLYLKRDGGKDKDRNGKRAADTRFVIEVDLSEMGTMQIDGFVQKETANTAFDLIIRTHTPFSVDQQHVMTQIFTDTAQISGFKGSISFQVMHEFNVKPLEHIVTSSPGITI